MVVVETQPSVILKSRAHDNLVMHSNFIRNCIKNRFLKNCAHVLFPFITCKLHIKFNNSSEMEQ